MVFIGERYNGPPGSGNGGYSCGLVAAALPPGDGIPEVTLRTPPPLERELRVEQVDGGITVLDDVTLGARLLIAEARRVAADLEAPDPVSFAAAVAASAGSPSHHYHPYPGCFVCGPARAEGDGLRIISGAVAGRRVAGSAWTPNSSVADDDGVVREEVVWAALDCPSWFGFACFETWEGRPLLGRLAADIMQLPHAGDHLVSLGWFIERDGRKVHSGAALYDDDGTLLARSRATWLIVP